MSANINRTSLITSLMVDAVSKTRYYFCESTVFTRVMAMGIIRLINIRFVNLGAKRKAALFLVPTAFLCSSFIVPPPGNPAYPDMGLHTVVIDAGHGGKDPGCVGTAAKEKDIALGIALKLGEKINKNHKDVKVIYTRDDDNFVELYERAKIANHNHADLFICIHVNANQSKTPRGVETYVMGLHKTNANLNVAKRENASILMEDNYETHYEGFNPNSDESYIALSLRQSAFLEQSLNFAAKVQKQFKTIGREDRGVRQAGFLVLWRTAMPSVLIETGFISNPDEQKYLMEDKNQEDLATSIYKAFKEYKSEFDRKLKPGKGRKDRIAGDKGDKGHTIKHPVPDNNLATGSEVFLKVQITSSLQPIPLKPEYFNGLTGVSEYRSKGMYKYTIGSEKSMNEASRLQAFAREKGFADAFVVAFKGDERIPLDKGLIELK